MPGGIWTAQNKIIPGAYINYKSVPTEVIATGNRGVATIPLPMSWGPEGEIIEINATDLLDGKSESKIGYVYTDSKSLPFRECLTYCAKLYAFRVDAGGKKATIEITSTVPSATMIATAKYAGVVGNDISIVVSSNTEGKAFEVRTLYRTRLKDLQKVNTVQELVANDWVTFTGTGTLPLTVGTYLAQGTDGTITDTVYTDYVAKVQSLRWNTMAIPVKSNSTLAPMFHKFISDRRDAKGIKCQVVLYNYANADYEGVISTTQGYKTQVESIVEEIFVCTVAGMTAGATYNESNTAKVLGNAVQIINPLTEEEIEKAVVEGHFVLGINSSNKVAVIKDINTFTTWTIEKNYPFSKNLIIRVIDSIDADLQYLWENSYQGKVKNLDGKRTLFKGNIGSLINKVYVAQEAVTDFNSARDVSVVEGDKPDSVVAGLTIKAVDVMEILYMSVLLR